MNSKLLILLLIWTTCEADDYNYHPINITRSTVAGIAAYRSALTLDWLAAEDQRQREMANAFETIEPPPRVISTDCIAYPRPTPGKIAGHLLELLRNLEDENGELVQELFESLIRSKILVQTSELEAEPNFESLVKTPEVMEGEPHATFPRIMSVIWMAVTDTAIVKNYGWCPIRKMNQFLAHSKSRDVAKQMRALDMVVDRARYIMEDFIRSITPINIFHSRKPPIRVLQQKKLSGKEVNVGNMINHGVLDDSLKRARLAASAEVARPVHHQSQVYNCCINVHSVHLFFILAFCINLFYF